MLHIVRTIFLWRGTAYQRIGLQNHGDRLASLDLTLLFDNDFADLFEVRGERRPRRGIGLEQTAWSRRRLARIQRAGWQFALHRAAFRSAADAACGQCRDLSSRAGAATGHARCLLRHPATSRPPSSRLRSFADCWRIAAKCAVRRRAPPASKHQTISSTRCCASRWPTSTC